MPEDTGTTLPKGSIYEAILRLQGAAIAVTQASVIVVLSIDGEDKTVTIDRSTGETR